MYKKNVTNDVYSNRAKTNFDYQNYDEIKVGRHCFNARSVNYSNMSQFEISFSTLKNNKRKSPVSAAGLPTSGLEKSG